MAPLARLESLYDASRGTVLPLPPNLEDLYGSLRFPLRMDRPFVVGNFVTTLDGIVSLNVPGLMGGGPIGGYNPHDRMIMGLLRSAADAVVVGAGTLRALPDHVWTAESICPSLAESYRALRAAMGKTEPPISVIVTGRGDIDPGLPVFASGTTPVLVVTGPEGARRIAARGLPPSVRVAAVESEGPISAEAVLDAAVRLRPPGIVLVEGGPHLLAHFFMERYLDEMFLTLAPQVVGQDDAARRPGMVEGIVIAPGHPRWGTLVGVKRGGNHLFLRYSFAPAA